MKQTLSKITTFLGSRSFFWIVMTFFGVEALWIAVSAIYPMAFDEDFHLGIIKLYAMQWSPFFTHHPANADVYGAVVRDPSYLYHYLMSFPYRLIKMFTSDQTIQIIFLRFINVVLFGWSLILFRRLMLRAKVSSAFASVALAIFVLIPITPLLAAHINYDNLLILLIAWVCLLVADTIDAARARRVPVKVITMLVIACMLASLVKYAFAPIFITVVGFEVILFAYYFRGKFKTRFLKSTISEYRLVSRRTKIILLCLLVLSTGLFVERYGVNTIVYKSPTGECDSVLSVEQCLSYGPWARNYQYAHDKGTFTPQPVSFVESWFTGMAHRLFFMINGNVPGPANYQNAPPLPLPLRTAVTVFTISILTLMFYSRRVFRNNWLLIFLAGMSIIYMIAIFYETYSSYLYTGRAVAINGRYLLPILFPITACMAPALSFALRRASYLKPVLAVAVIGLFMQGGGVFSFIVFSNHAWYWDNHLVQAMNDGVQGFFQNVIVGAKDHL